MTRKTYHHAQCHYPILSPERASKLPLFQRSQKILQALFTLELRAGISQAAEEMVQDRTTPKQVSYHLPQVIQLHTSALITASSSWPSSTTSFFSLKSSTTILICRFAVLLPLFHLCHRRLCPQHPPPASSQVTVRSPHLCSIYLFIYFLCLFIYLIIPLFNYLFILFSSLFLARLVFL